MCFVLLISICSTSLSFSFSQVASGAVYSLHKTSTRDVSNPQFSVLIIYDGKFVTVYTQQFESTVSFVGCGMKMSIICSLCLKVTMSLSHPL